MALILASNSPRRTEILTLAHIKHKVIPSTCQETILDGLTLFEVVEHLSYQKALDVAKHYPNEVVLGADTVVAIEGKILGKPHDKKEAIWMLQSLSGKTHQVVTGITIIYQGQIKTFHEVTEVEVIPLSIEQILDYVQKEYIYDKAGSYAIQGSFCRYISKIVGDYYNVVGLPICRVYQELKEFEYEIQ